MITKSEYNELNEGDIVTARYTNHFSKEEFEVTSKVYEKDGRRCLIGWYLDNPIFSEYWTIINVSPLWHSARVISANWVGERRVFVRHSKESNRWIGDTGFIVKTEDLRKVKILVAGDVEL
jgi:hypothetical protein